jgi:hypothetical protein
VIVAPVGNRPNTFIYNAATNSFVAGPSNLGNTNESAWVKLPDNSILFIRTLGTVSERYIPGTNSWVTDATVPVALYESLGAETGAAFLLPDGRAVFLGGNSNTAYYTPSGDATDGSWTAGPNIPNSLSAPDAAAAMMVDGNILCALSPTLTCCDAGGNNIFNTPTSFYVFDYTANSFTQVNAPAGGLTVNIPAYKTNMLDLPNGQVLYSQQGSAQYYVFTPSGSQLAAGKPVINNIDMHGDGSFTLHGTLLNGISEGASYGDDWQMNTNYPLVRLTNGANVYYARTYNWSSTGVATGSTPQTTEFTLPAGLPPANYQLQVIANGIASDPVDFCTPHIDIYPSVTTNYNGRDVSCFKSCDGGATANPVGAFAPVYNWSNGASTESVAGLCPGVYTVTATNLLGLGCSVTKTITIQNTPELLTSTSTSDFNGYGVSCHGGNNGTATAHPTGGTPPYSYSWSNGATSASNTGLTAGTYNVTVTDANGCSTSGSATITEPPALLSTAAPTSNYNGYNVRCHGGSDGVAEAFPSGGVAPYSYLWSDGQTTKVASNLSAGTYQVTVTDANGCTVSASCTLTEPPQLTINAGANKIVYLGYPDSACTDLTATGLGGGVPPYTITWSNGSHNATINVCPALTTVYTATISDANGCSFSDDVTVCVIDVRCGPHMDKVLISHKTGSSTNPCVTLCVALPAAVNHIAHGDELAPCGTVKVCNDDGLATRAGVVKQVVAEKENTGNIYVKVFPNPFSSATNVEFMLGETDIAGLKLFDVSGKEIMTLFQGQVEANKMYHVSLNGSRLSNGMYFLKLTSRNGNNYIGKLMISR